MATINPLSPSVWPILNQRSSYDKVRIAGELWLNFETIISEEMVSKVNAVAKYLAKEGYELSGVPADGDCFCHAFLKSNDSLSSPIPILSTVNDPVDWLRQQIAVKVGLRDLDRAESIKEKSMWIDAIEGEWLAKVLKIPIRLVTSEGEAVSDMLTFTDHQSSQEWKSLQNHERPERYITIVDLGGHFITAVPCGSGIATDGFTKYSEASSINTHLEQNTQPDTQEKTENLSHDIFSQFTQPLQTIESPIMDSFQVDLRGHLKAVDQTSFAVMVRSNIVQLYGKESKIAEQEFDLPENALDILALRNGTIYYFTSDQQNYSLSIKNRSESRCLFQVPKQPWEIVVSPSASLIALRFTDAIEIYDVKGNQIGIYERAKKIQFVAEKGWCIVDHLSRLQFYENAKADPILLREYAVKQFFAEPTGRLLLVAFQAFGWPSINVYDLKTNECYALPNYGRDLEQLAFLSSTQVLLIFIDRYPNNYPSKQTIEIFDLQKRKELYQTQCALDVKIFPCGDKLLFQRGEEITVKCIPTSSDYEFKIVNLQGRELTIEGDQLLRIAYTSFRKVWQEVTQNGSQNLNRQSSGRYHITKAEEWLKTAGYLSNWSTRQDIKKPEKDLWYRPKGVTIQLTKEGLPVDITSNGLVKFKGSGWDYGSLAKDVGVKSTEDEMTLDDVVKIINSSWTWSPESNQEHVELAETLLRRIRLESYPATFSTRDQQFYDALILLLIGVESSRNNVTFLTTLLLLDLIKSGARIREGGQSYGFNSAFISGNEYQWNDVEQKDLGGTFPMATNSAGSGNFAERIRFIKGEIPIDKLLEDPQKNRIALAEMKLMIDWLRNLCEEHADVFKQSTNSAELESSLQQLFEKRLRSSYLTNNSENFLEVNDNRYYRNSQPLRQHYEDDQLFYFLTHSEINSKTKLEKKTTDNFYHRLDLSCQTLPGYVLNGGRVDSNKDITRTSTLNVKHKIPNKLVRVIQPINLGNEKFSDLFKSKLEPLIKSYQQWLVTYFDAEAVFRTLQFQSMLNIYEVSIPLFMHVLRELEWAPTLKYDESFIDDKAIRKCVRQYYKKELNTEALKPYYVGKIIRKIQDLIDAMMDRGRMRLLSGMAPTDPPRDFKLLVLKQLAHKHDLMSDLNEPWLEWICHLADHNPNFSYEMKYLSTNLEDKKLSPCHSCYSQALAYPIIPYVDTRLVALTSASSRYFHRPGSTCNQIVMEGRDYFLNEQNKEKGEFRFVAQLREAKKPCPHCWITNPDKGLKREGTALCKNDNKRARLPPQ